VLAMPDFQQVFTFETDASESGMGAILMQQVKPIAYFGKASSIKSNSLSIYKKELLALIATVQKWCHYLQERSFVIKTDHFSLKYLLEQRLTYPIQHKGLCKLLGLDYTIQYKKDVRI
jgi:RNase H-like domain found in reverse transcriptase